MQFRKFRAEGLFDGHDFVHGKVLITDKHGVVEGIVPDEDAGGDVEELDGILSPGFVNCHCHLELSHMKGVIPEKTGLIDFVFKVVTQRHFSDEEILQAIERGEQEMLDSGIVAVGDICNNALTLTQKQKRRLLYYNFIEASGWLPSISGERFRRAQALLQQFSATGASVIVPHAPYSVSQELWSAIQPFFGGKTVSIHNQETAFEDEFFQKGSGDFLRMYKMMGIDNGHHQPTSRSSLQSYFEKMSAAKNVLLVHNSFSKQEDVDFVQLKTENSGPETFFCLCVNANQYIEDAWPPVDMLRSSHCNIVLGTDSLASNWSLNILDEIKTLRSNFPAVPLEEMLRWATVNGAKALQMEAQLGSFEKGKKPGLVLIDEGLEKSVRIL